MIIARENTENGEIVLRQGLAGYEIIVDGQFLMSSASGDSSKALIKLGLEKLRPRNNLKVLVAGLGLGFSLKVALETTIVSRVTIVELEKRLIEWHQSDLIFGSAQSLNDQRVSIKNQDFLRYCDDCREKFDLIALDIDNGPGWLSHESNSGLYTSDYLKQINEILNPQGILTVWSAAVSPGLRQTLAEIYGDVEEVEVLDHNGEGKTISAFIYICGNTV